MVAATLTNRHAAVNSRRMAMSPNRSTLRRMAVLVVLAATLLFGTSQPLLLCVSADHIKVEPAETPHALTSLITVAAAQATRTVATPHENCVDVPIAAANVQQAKKDGLRTVSTPAPAAVVVDAISTRPRMARAVAPRDPPVWRGLSPERRFSILLI